MKALLRQAAAAIREADAILIGAGAGMGVDSGLPDFRGNDGFWTAYPALYGRSFSEMANPVWFSLDPAVAWGFYGHRLELYRNTQPHAGYAILRRWTLTKPAGYFVFTSNVDGHFASSGFPPEHIYECHGSIHHLQCVNGCSKQIWSADQVALMIDQEKLRAESGLPQCMRCGSLARPNVLMFGDDAWLHHRSSDQERRYIDWLEKVRCRRVVAIELGAGTAIPSVRWECQQRAGMLIRINPREADVSPGNIALPMNALQALAEIDEIINPHPALATPTPLATAQT